MIDFKSCPKCRGDMYQDKDFYGEFLTCLQCGLTNDLESPSDNEKPHSLAQVAASLGAWPPKVGVQQPL